MPVNSHVKTHCNTRLIIEMENALHPIVYGMCNESHSTMRHSRYFFIIQVMEVLVRVEKSSLAEFCLCKKNQGMELFFQKILSTRELLKIYYKKSFNFMSYKN